MRENVLFQRRQVVGQGEGQQFGDIHYAVPWRLKSENGAMAR